MSGVQVSWSVFAVVCGTWPQVVGSLGPEGKRVELLFSRLSPLVGDILYDTRPHPAKVPKRSLGHRG